MAKKALANFGNVRLFIISVDITRIQNPVMFFIKLMKIIHDTICEIRCESVSLI